MLFIGYNGESLCSFCFDLDSFGVSLDVWCQKKPVYYFLFFLDFCYWIPFLKDFHIKLKWNSLFSFISFSFLQNPKIRFRIHLCPVCWFQLSVEKKERKICFIFDPKEKKIFRYCFDFYLFIYISFRFYHQLIQDFFFRLLLLLLSYKLDQFFWFSSSTLLFHILVVWLWFLFLHIQLRNKILLSRIIFEVFCQFFSVFSLVKFVCALKNTDNNNFQIDKFKQKNEKF